MHLITHCFNKTINESTGLSPFVVLYGRRLGNSLVITHNSQKISTSKYFELLQKRISQIEGLVKETAQLTRKKMKEQFDRRKRSFTFCENDLVLVKNMVWQRGTSSNFNEKFSGHFKVFTLLNQGLNLIIDLASRFCVRFAVFSWVASQ